MFTSRLSLAFIALGLLASCTQKSASHSSRPAPEAGLSSEENDYVQKLEKSGEASQNGS